MRANLTCLISMVFMRPLLQKNPPTPPSYVILPAYVAMALLSTNTYNSVEHHRAGLFILEYPRNTTL